MSFLCIFILECHNDISNIFLEFIMRFKWSVWEGSPTCDWWDWSLNICFAEGLAEGTKTQRRENVLGSEKQNSDPECFAPLFPQGRCSHIP